MQLLDTISSDTAEYDWADSSRICVENTAPYSLGCTSLRPSIQNRVIQKQANDKQRHDAHEAERTFRAGDTVCSGL